MIVKEAVGALQEFTRRTIAWTRQGEVWDTPVVTVSNVQHVCEFRIHVCAWYTYTKKRQRSWNLLKSSVGAHCIFFWIPDIKANYNVLWISIIGDSPL